MDTWIDLCVPHRQWEIKWERGKKKKRKQVCARPSPLKSRLTCFWQHRSGGIWFVLAWLVWTFSCGSCVVNMAVSCSRPLCFVVANVGQAQTFRKSAWCRTGQPKESSEKNEEDRASEASCTEELTTLTSLLTSMSPWWLNKIIDPFYVKHRNSRQWN